MNEHELDPQELQKQLDELIASGASQEQVLDDIMNNIDDLVNLLLEEEEVIDEPIIDDTPSVDEPIDVPPKPEGFTVEVTDIKFDKDYERLTRMTQVFGKFATTLLSRRIRVDLDNANSVDAPAWSDSESMTFNRSKIGKLDNAEVVTNLRGLTIHEIAHILMTPRDGTQLVKMVRQGKLWSAFNALEDMRIESFMTTRYSNVSDWLVATIAQHLLNSPAQIPLQFPLIYGRKYLPSDIRIMVRDAYINQADIPELQQLIDDYIVLNLADPAKYNQAFSIILRYNELVESLAMHGGTSAWDSIRDANGHSKRPMGEWKPNNGKALNKVQQASIAGRIKINNGSAYDNKPSTDGNQPSDNNSDSGSPSDSTSKSAGNQSSTNTDILQNVLDKLYERRHEEIIDTIKQFNGEAVVTGKVLPPPPKYWRQESRAVSPDAVVASRSFGTELEQLRGDYDPYWDRRVSSGRLNVQRYLTENNVEEAFDQWELGREDAVDIECVVLLDISGSMEWCINSAYESMWAIKRALDKINASTTVVAFDSEAYSIYSASERAGIQMRYSGSAGGTNPKSAIAYASSVLANSERAIKLLIAITDGEWYDSKDTDATINRLRQAGVVTSLAYVSDPKYISPGSVVRINNHGCEVAVNITDARDLFTLARRLVKVGVARNLA